MFGYIVPCVPEMKVREFERYRQYYCGVCRALKARYNRTTLLNYDAVFICVLADALTDADVCPEKARCVLHPVKGTAALKVPGASYAADVNLLMGYASAADDTTDEGGLSAALAAFHLRRPFRKASENVPSMTRAMEECQRALVRIEAERCAMPDAAAEPYGKLFGNVLMDLDVLQSHVLYDLGYNIGRWVYLIDAWDDLEEDEKNGQYNVYAQKARAGDISKDDLRDAAAFSMHYTLSQAADALSRLELKQNREILSNIVRLGLYAQTRSILSGQGRLFHESIRSPRRI